LVAAVWILESCHTFFVAATLWDHFIVHYGDLARIDYIPWSLGLTIVFTGVLTILVHFTLVFRVFKLSHHSYILAVPLGLLSAIRLAFAFFTTIKMIQLRSISQFGHFYRSEFSAGLAICAGLDIVFAFLLCFFLRRNMKKNSSMNRILGSLIQYAFENGVLNCVASVATLVCWLTMSNLIFLGIHFAISKLYANSLITILNARKDLYQTSQGTKISPSGDRNQPVMFASESSTLSRDTSSLRVYVNEVKTSTADTNNDIIHIKV